MFVQRIEKWILFGSICVLKSALIHCWLSSWHISFFPHIVLNWVSELYNHSFYQLIRFIFTRVLHHITVCHWIKGHTRANIITTEVQVDKRYLSWYIYIYYYIMSNGCDQMVAKICMFSQIKPSVIGGSRHTLLGQYCSAGEHLMVWVLYIYMWWVFGVPVMEQKEPSLFSRKPFSHLERLQTTCL